jgi:hypothetical protein
MIIQLDAAAPAATTAAQRALDDLTRRWGHQTTQAPAPATPAATRDGQGKAIDPVAVSSLVVSLPSAALAVADLADRIRKRRRAQELITTAQHLADKQVTASLVTGSRTIDLSTMTPDQLLDLLTSEDPTT